MTDMWLTPYSVWQKPLTHHDLAVSRFLFLLPFLFVLDYIGKEFVQSLPSRPLRGSSGHNSSRPCHSGATTFQFLYISTINAVLEPACTRGDVRPLWEDAPAESTRIPFGSILIFYGDCRWSSCFCKYSVHELFYSFILSIANCHVYTVWFYFFLSRLRPRTFGGLKPTAPARPPLLPLQVCLLYVGSCQGHDDLSSMFYFYFLYLVLLTIISCSGAFFPWQTQL